MERRQLNANSSVREQRCGHALTSPPMAYGPAPDTRELLTATPSLCIVTRAQARPENISSLLRCSPSRSSSLLFESWIPLTRYQLERTWLNFVRSCSSTKVHAVFASCRDAGRTCKYPWGRLLLDWSADLFFHDFLSANPHAYARTQAGLPVRLAFLRSFGWSYSMAGRGALLRACEIRLILHLFGVVIRPPSSGGASNCSAVQRGALPRTLRPISSSIL